MITKIDTLINKTKIDDIVKRNLKGYNIKFGGVYNHPLRCSNVYYDAFKDPSDLRTEILSIETDYAGKKLVVRVKDRLYENLADKIAADYEVEFPEADISVLI